MFLTYNQLLVKERNKQLKFNEVYFTEQGVYYVLIGGKIKLYPTGGDSYDGDPTVIVQDSTHRFVSDTEKTSWNAKQAALVSGTNIKTINGTSILGAGDVTISGTVTLGLGEIGYGDPATGNITSSSAFTISSGKVKVGTGTPTFNSDLNLVNTNAYLSLTATGTGNNGTIIFMGDSTPNYGYILKYNASYTSVIGGTSITTNGALFIDNSSSGEIALRSIGAGAIYNMPGNSGTAYGTRLDAIGLRIGQLSTLHTSNTYNFECSGTGLIGDLSTAHFKHNITSSQIGVGSTQFLAVSGTLYGNVSGVTQFTMQSGLLDLTSCNLVVGGDTKVNGNAYIKDGTQTLNYIFTCTDASTGKGAWMPPPSGATLADADYGDITVSSSGTVWTIDNLAVTNAKINSIAWSKITSTPTTLSGYAISDTKANFDTALSDGNFLYVGDITQYTDEMAQDAVGGILTDSSTLDFTYDDAANTITGIVKDASISLAKMADVATSTVFYRKTAGTGVPEVQTLATLKTDLGLTGTNSGDQTTITGNAGSATILQTPRTIGGVSFDGSANIVPQTIQSINEATDTTCFPLFISASGTQSLQPLNNAGFIYNSSTNSLTATTFIGALTGTASGNLVSGGALGTPSSGTLTNCTFPTLNQNTSGTAANLSGTPALPNGTTATTQAASDNSTKLATTAYADAKVADAINDATTTIAPSQNAVFDALTTKGQVNNAEFSQITVAGTSYYITRSDIAVPTNLAVGSSMSWRMHISKTAAGTGTFVFKIYRGTNATIADTADVTQSIGTQTAVADNMVVDITLYVNTTGATGGYFWTICPVQQAASATGFGIVTGTTGLFSGTVSSVAMNTAGLKFGIGFVSTTGTPTVRVVQIKKTS